MKKDMCILRDKGKRKLFIITLIVLVLGIMVATCALYLGDYYRADEGAIAEFSPTENITASTLKNGSVVFEPQSATTGLIFYPGGKVEHLAYEQLMAGLAREGILCVLIEMPFNLAVLNINAADGIQEKYPQIEEWYIGGHSLGGSMAASYLEKNAEAYGGLVLLGSYSTVDLSDIDLDVLSVYGSEDKVMNREKYDENKSNLPSDVTEIVINGGCHAYFGMYGEQDGDGIPSITVSEQISTTVDNIVKMMKQE